MFNHSNYAYLEVLPSSAIAEPSVHTSTQLSPTSQNEHHPEATCTEETQHVETTKQSRAESVRGVGASMAENTTNNLVRIRGGDELEATNISTEEWMISSWR